MTKLALLVVVGTLSTGCAATAPEAAMAPPQTVESAEDTFLLTVFLKHDQAKTLDTIKQELESTGFWANFPPEGIEIESWYVMMGVGQVVTIRVPPSRLREVNVAIERSAWGAFRTEFYPTYDLHPVQQELRKKALAR